MILPIFYLNFQDCFMHFRLIYPTTYLIDTSTQGSRRHPKLNMFKLETLATFPKAVYTLHHVSHLSEGYHHLSRLKPKT